MRRFFLILLIVIISVILLFSVFKTNRAYAGTCSAPTQSQLLSMTTGTQVYNALDCVSQSDLNNLLNSLTPDQLYSVTTLMNTTQLDGVMGILNSDQIGYLVYQFGSNQLYNFLNDLGSAETYNFLDNTVPSTGKTQAQLLYDSLSPLISVVGTIPNGSPQPPQDFANVMVGIGQYSGTDLYNILNILNQQVQGNSNNNKNYLYTDLYALSGDQLYDVVSLLPINDFYSIFDSFNSTEIVYTLGWMSSTELYNLLSQLSSTQLYNLLSNLNNNDLNYILGTVLSSSDLQNLFPQGSQNFTVLQELAPTPFNWEFWAWDYDIWASYYGWFGYYNNGNGESISGQSYQPPPGSNSYQPPPHVSNTSHNSNNPYPTNGGGPGIGNQPPGNGGGGGGTPSACYKNSLTSVYNCNVNITITTQAPNEPSYSQSGGASVTVANPQ